MNEVLAYLQKCGTYYIATIDDDQPRVRPFGAAAIYEDRLYIVTNNQKPVFRQMQRNPKIEISCAAGDGSWLRLTARAVQDPRPEAKTALLEALPSLKSMYSADDGIFEVLYLQDATATFASFGGDPKIVTF